MTKIDIISGFLGAGKTTLIQKLLEENVFENERLVLIENEYGEIGIDGTILKSSGIEIKEMNSGCICCSIAGDFRQALKDMMKRFSPDRIMIEPSGVGKLSDVIGGCQPLVKEKKAELNLCIAVIDGMKYKIYRKNFAEFYIDQLTNAKLLILSRTQYMKPEELDYVLQDIRRYNQSAPLITTQWEQLSGAEIVALSKDARTYELEKDVMEIQKSHHHHADEVFSVWSKETARVFEAGQLKDILKKLNQENGIILRAKGIVRADSGWVQFNYVPGESTIMETEPDCTGRICVIGNNLDQMRLTELFGG